MCNNTKYDYFTVVGYGAGRNATNLSGSVYVGYQAGYCQTTGGTNVGIGINSLWNNITGQSNVAIGANSLCDNTTGTENVAIGGNLTLWSNTTGYSNIAVGNSSLQCNITGICNVAVGQNALRNQTASFYNTALGTMAGCTLTGGNNNTLIGHNAQPSSVSVSNEITLGDANVTDLRVPGVGFYIDGGNVGIGTSSPNGSDFGSNTGLLHIKDLGSSNTGIKIEDGTAKIILMSNGTNNYFGSWSNHPLLFYTNLTERMRIDSSGNVGIANTNPNYNLEIGESDGVSNRGLSFNLNNNVGQIRTRSNLSDTQTHYEIINSNGVVGTIKTVGSATQFNTSSDYRLKENVSYDFDATTRLKQLKPARFNFIADADTTVDGFLAHEVSSVVPEAISGEKDAVDENGNPEYQGIDQSKLVPVLTKALQEAITKIEELEARINTLENV